MGINSVMKEKKMYMRMDTVVNGNRKIVGTKNHCKPFFYFKHGGNNNLKSEKFIWWSTLFGFLLYAAVSMVLISICAPVLMISELNISQKAMMVLGFIVCEYGWVLLIKNMVIWSRHKISKTLLH